MPEMTKHERNVARSQQALLAAKARFDAHIADLQKMSADHFGADPEGPVWGVAANLETWNDHLRRVTDSYFKRGEWAEEG